MLGENHLDTLATMNNYAIFLDQYTDRNDEAKNLFVRANSIVPLQNGQLSPRV